MKQTEKYVKVGDMVSVLDGRVGFINENGEKINMPVGAIIHFPKGFAIRQYCDITGAGMYGHPISQLWTTTVAEQEGKIGLILPRCEEKLETVEKRGWFGKWLFGEEWKIIKIGVLHREPTFIPLFKIRYGIARVENLP